MKGAIRHLALDGAGSKAIVVCADIAEYARGSSGEPTQGAGAVAMLLEENPTLATVDLVNSGSASDYRIFDFRKPMRYAVFNGGKRVRPLLVYATGEALDVPPEWLDAPATAIELLHAPRKLGPDRCGSA